MFIMLKFFHFEIFSTINGAPSHGATLLLSVSRNAHVGVLCVVVVQQLSTVCELVQALPYA